MQDIIVFENVTKVFNTYKNPKNIRDRILNLIYPYREKVIALDNVSFKIKEKGSIGLLGPNGAGKTTVSKLIAAIIFPTRGSVYVKGFNTKENADEVKKLVGIQSETIPMYNKLTVKENLEFFARFYDLDKKEIEEKIQYLSELFGFKKYLNRIMEGFSTGMRIKVQIARALIHDPEILILDEPFANIDVFARGYLKEFIRELKDRTIILTSHFLNDIEDLCKKIILIDHGKIAGIYNTEDFWN